jgi:peptide deformylase
MILMKDIVREGNQILRNESKNIDIPLKDEDKKMIIEMLGYLVNSQNEQRAKELDLRPGVGLAAPQIGINKNVFAVLLNDFDDKLWFMAVINPKIISASKEMTYLPGGEGCLSVDRETTGITPRHRYITIEAYIFNPNRGTLEKKKLNLKDYVAIVFQHEYDHLLGTLYVDTIIDEAEAKKQGMKPLWETEE